MTRIMPPRFALGAASTRTGAAATPAPSSAACLRNSRRVEGLRSLSTFSRSNSRLMAIASLERWLKRWTFGICYGLPAPGNNPATGNDYQEDGMAFQELRSGPGRDLAA